MSTLFLARAVDADHSHVCQVTQGQVKLGSESMPIATDVPEGQLVSVRVVVEPVDERALVDAALATLRAEHSGRAWGWLAHSRCLQAAHQIPEPLAEQILQRLVECGHLRGPETQANSCGSPWPGWYVR